MQVILYNVKHCILIVYNVVYLSYTQPEMTLYSYTYIFGITSYILYIYPILHTYEERRMRKMAILQPHTFVFSCLRVAFGHFYESC